MIKRPDRRQPSLEVYTLPRCDDRTDHAYSLLPNQSPSVLRVLISRHDAQLLEALSKAQGWTFGVAGSWPDALGVVEEHRIAVVLLPREILGTDWREGLRLLLQPSHRSKVLLITSTPLDSFCQSFVEEGGFGVLPSPLQDVQVLDHVQRAWTSWKTSVAAPYAY